MVAHSSLTGADLHEPKGVASAAANTAYIANGSGSGVWKKPDAANVAVQDAGSIFTASNVEDVLEELYELTLPVSGHFEDVSNIETVLLPIPFSCTVVSIKMILGGAITIADTTISVSRSDGASMGSQVIEFAGSAEGTIFTFVPSSNANFTGGTHNYIKLVSDGGSTTSTKLYLQALIRRT
jgi:hypothetical protein